MKLINASLCTDLSLVKPCMVKRYRHGRMLACNMYVGMTTVFQIQISNNFRD